MIRFFFRILLSYLAFPGVIVHEFGHQVFCHLTGTRVREVCYFRIGFPAGYVVHDMPTNPWKHLLIASGPFFMNTAVGFLLGLAAIRAEALPLFAGTAKGLLLWLGVSVALHAFPSLDDATSLLESIWTRPSDFLVRFVITILGGLMVVGAFGAFFLVDLAYGILMAWLLPRLFTGAVF
jgi:hypothetical protein